MANWTVRVLGIRAAANVVWDGGRIACHCGDVQGGCFNISDHNNVNFRATLKFLRWRSLCRMYTGQ